MREARVVVRWGVLLLLAACAPLGETKPPQVHLTDIRMLPGGLLEQRFQVDLRVGNPNDFDLPLDGLTFALELNDQPFAQGFTDQAVTVPRLGEATVPVVASTSLLEMVQQILILGERENLSYRIDGVVYLRGFGGREVPYARGGMMKLRPATSERPTLVPL